MMHEDSGKEDRRQARTRRSLHSALFALMQEKRYDAITVQDIIDRADVGRSTFYAHYQGKEDLAVESIKEMVDALTEFIQREAGQQRLLPIKEWFEHIREQERLFRNLIRGEALSMFFEEGRTYWSKKLGEQLRAQLTQGRTASVPLALLTHLLIGAMFDLLKWWLDSGTPYSPERMDEYFHRLMWPAVRAALKEQD